VPVLEEAFEAMTEDSRTEKSIDELVRVIRGNLRPEGPPVDYQALLLYAGGDLDAEQSQRVREHIVAWQSWNDAYWQIVDDLADPHGWFADDAADVQRPTGRNWSLRRIAALFTSACLLVIVAVGTWLIMGRNGTVIDEVVDSPGRVLRRYANGAVTGPESYPEPWRTRIDKLLRTGRIKYPTDVLAFADMRLRGSPSSTYIAPVSTVVRTDRPTFRWKPHRRAEYYHVEVIAADAAMLKSPSVDGTEWVIDTPLRRGEVFSWRVVVVHDGQEEDLDELEPRFMVLAKGSLAELERREAELGETRLGRSLLFVEYGLMDEAIAELKELAAANPDSSLARSLLESILSRP